MGDLIALLHSVDLSPVNTLLLVGLFYLVHLLFGYIKELKDTQLAQIRKALHRNTVDIARLGERVGIIVSQVDDEE